MLVKTHLIITDQYDEYEVKYVAKLIELSPHITPNNSLSFVIVSRNSRYEINTNDFKYLEEMAKKFTITRGKEAYTEGTSRIYIKEQGGKETLLAIVWRKHYRVFAPMYDDVALPCV